MKLAYFIETIIPSKRANTVHVMRMCQAFTKLGYNVTLFCDADNSNLCSLDDIWAQYGITEKFEINRVILPALLRKYGHRFASILSAMHKVKNINNYDIAYGRSPYCISMIKNKIPFIFEAHAEPDRLNRNLEKNILMSANCLGLVVISEALKKRYMEMYPFFNEEKITVLHDCADIPDDSFENIAKLQMVKNRKKLNIGYLGHLYPGKCMEVLIPVAKTCSEYTFHIVGGTEEWIKHWKQILQEQKVANIIFYGYIDNAKVGEYYKAFDVCILPFSKEVYVAKNKSLNIGKWISPLKLFEAMSYRCAILVSRIPTIEEVLTDGINCLFADPDNIDEWKDKIEQLNDENLRKRLGDAARKTLEERYTWDKRAAAISHIFDEVKQQ